LPAEASRKALVFHESLSRFGLMLKKVKGVAAKAEPVI
jgi:hypothetical protein